MFLSFGEEYHYPIQYKKRKWWKPHCLKHKPWSIFAVQSNRPSQQHNTRPYDLNYQCHLFPFLIFCTFLPQGKGHVYFQTLLLIFAGPFYLFSSLAHCYSGYWFLVMLWDHTHQSHHAGPPLPADPGCLLEGSPQAPADLGWTHEGYPHWGPRRGCCHWADCGPLDPLGYPL